MIESFRHTWDFRGSPAWQRRYRIFERDGWRCRVPGCSSRRNLQVHHIVFRSRGGGGEDDNLVTVCVTHHLRCLHAGTLRCHRLPDGLLAWEFGGAPCGAEAGGGSPGATAGSPMSDDDTPDDDTRPDDTKSDDPSPLDSPPVNAPTGGATTGADSHKNGTIERYVEDVLWAAARNTVRSAAYSTACSVSEDH
jgi:hypothetical protein